MNPLAVNRAEAKARRCNYGICAGQFLENIARYLSVSLEEVGTLSLQADTPETYSSICAVLAETDVINMVSRGELVMSLGVSGPVLIAGGLAADQGLVAAMRESAVGQKMTVDVRSHPQSIPAGALGAAVWGAFRVRKLRALEIGVVTGAVLDRGRGAVDAVDMPATENRRRATSHRNRS